MYKHFLCKVGNVHIFIEYCKKGKLGLYISKNSCLGRYVIAD